MSDRFFFDGPLGPGDVTLDGPEAHHLAAVCRFGPGDAVTLFNGDGREYPARVVEVGKKRVTLASDRRSLHAGPRTRLPPGHRGGAARRATAATSWSRS